MSETSLKLYGVSASQPVRSVIWLLEINSIPYELAKMSPGLSKKDPRKQKYIKEINPLGLVPSLQDNDNGLIMYESPAILAYISSKHNLNEWYPKEDLIRRAKIDQYLHWHHGTVRVITKSYIAPLLRADVALEKWMKRINVMVQERKSLKFVLATLEKRHFANQLYLVDDKPSIADLLCYPEIVQLKSFQSIYPYSKFKSQYPNIDAWLTRMEKLPQHDKVHRVLNKLQGFISQRIEKTKPLQDAIASKL